jgi:hypothetical protein
MNLLDLFEGASDNLRALIQAVQTGGEAHLNLGGEPVTLDSNEVRWMYGKYKSFLKAGRQDEFVNDLNDPVRFDAHMRQLRSLLDKQRNFRGSVPGQRQVQGDVPQGLSEEIQSMVGMLAEDDVSPKARGIRHIGLIDKTRSTPEPVLIEFGPGQPKYRISQPQDKRWFLETWAGYRRTGQGDRFLELMGTPEGFERILDLFAQFHSQRQKQQQMAKQQQARQQRQPQGQPYMANYNPRLPQKKKFREADELTPKSKRFSQQLRAEYPQARSDSEALMYHITTTQNKTQQEIDDLEKNADSMEKDIRQDLEKKVASLAKRRGVTGGSLDKINATNDKQQEIINKIIRIDQEQQRALDDLESTVKGADGTTYRGTKPSATDTSTLPGVAPTPVRPSKPASVGYTPPSSATSQPVSIDLTDTEPLDIATISQPATEPSAKPEPSNVIPLSSRRKKKRQQSLPLDGEPSELGDVADIRQALKVAEGLADDFLKMANNMGYKNARIAGTPEQERERTQKMLAQRAKDRANAPAPQGPNTEERAGLEAKLKELEAKFDPDFEYSDDYSFWSRQNEIKKQISSIKQRLAQGVTEGPAVDAYMAGKSPAIAHYADQLDRIASKTQGVEEAQTDYQRRRQRERDIDAGKPVPKQRQSRMTDYQKKRAQDRKDMELGEGDERLADIQQKKAWLDQLIGMKEKIDQLVMRANRFPGGLERGLAADIENEELYGVPQTNQDYQELLSKYTKDLTNLQNYIQRKKSLYKEDQAVSESHGIRVSRDKNENIVNSQQELDEKQDACYQKVKSRYKVWPSAYASGALVQCRKKGADNWGTGGNKK